MTSKKDRYTGIVHAAAAVLMSAMLIIMITDVFINNPDFALDNLLLYAALLAYCVLNMLISWQINSQRSMHSHLLIALQFSVKAVPAAGLAAAVLIQQYDYFSSAMLGITAAMEFRLAWDYLKYRQPGRTSKYILGLFCLAQLCLALLFVMVSIEDNVMDYPSIVLPATSVICTCCLLIRSAGSANEEVKI